MIRQKILAGLGWRIYRIWSTDWFSNPVKEFKKLKNYIEEALNSKNPARLETDKLAVAYDAVPEDEAQQDLFDMAESQNEADAEKIVELFDTVTYFLIKDGIKREKCAVQIVPTQGDPDAGTVSQQSAIGRALLGNAKDEAIECALPIGEVTLEILHIDKYQ